MPIALTVKIALATALGGFAASLLAVFVAVATLDVASGVAVRTALIAALLIVVPFRLVRGRLGAFPRVRLLAAGIVGVALGFCINPSGWDGHSFFAQLLLEPGPAATVLDLAGWLAVGSGAVYAACRGPEAEASTPIAAPPVATPPIAT